MKEFKTTNPEIIKLYEDYQFLKYYKENVLDEIHKQYKPYDYRNAYEAEINLWEVKSEKKYHQKQIDNIKTFMNKQEYERFQNIFNYCVKLCSHYDKYSVYWCATEIDFFIDDELINDIISMVKKELYYLLDNRSLR